MKKLCCVAAMAVVLCGCAGTPTKSLTSGSTLQGKQIAVSQYAKPDFGAMTAGKAAFGLFGTAAMIGEGKAMLKRILHKAAGTCVGDVERHALML